MKRCPARQTSPSPGDREHSDKPLCRRASASSLQDPPTAGVRSMLSFHRAPPRVQVAGDGPDLSSSIIQVEEVSAVTSTRGDRGNMLRDQVLEVRRCPGRASTPDAACGLVIDRLLVGVAARVPQGHTPRPARAFAPPPASSLTPPSGDPSSAGAALSDDAASVERDQPTPAALLRLSAFSHQREQPGGWS